MNTFLYCEIIYNFIDNLYVFIIVYVLLIRAVKRIIMINCIHNKSVFVYMELCEMCLSGERWLFEPGLLSAKIKTPTSPHRF